MPAIIGNNFSLESAHANLDFYYGPYTTVEQAELFVPEEIRDVGLTIGILEFSKDNNGEYVYREEYDDFTNTYYHSYVKATSIQGEQRYSLTGINEYQWKAGISNDDLKPKVEKFNLTIAKSGDEELIKEEGDVIQLAFTIEGRVTVSKGFIYRVSGNTEILLGEFTNIGKGSSANTVVVTNPSTSGIYTYRIKVLDSSGSYATTVDGTEYVEYTVRYGGISIVYNFTNSIDIVQIKNKDSVADKPFTCNINVRDNSFNILNMFLTNDAGNNDNGISLQPYSDQIKTPSDNYLGYKWYFFPNSNNLEIYNGQPLYIKLKYTEDGTTFYKIHSLFTLLDIRSLELIRESDTNLFYIDTPSYFTFQLQSGVEKLNVVLSQHEDSDFTFDSVTLQSYSRFTLTMIPNNITDNAILKMNYSFRYDNITTSGTFTINIGSIVAIPEQNYFDPESGTDHAMILDKIIDSTLEDYNIIEDGQAVKIISEPITKNVYSSSFILDMYCKINQTNDKSRKYLIIDYGNIPIAYITEDEIFCKNMRTDTPLNEWVQIGLGINLGESITRNAAQTDVYYHSIYINGMIVKNVLIDGINNTILGFERNKQLSITVSNGISVKKCFLYYKNDGSEQIYPNTTLNQSIIYNNYKSHNISFSEPLDLPVLKLMKITDSQENEEYFTLINSYKQDNDEDLLKHTTTFGNIGATKADNIQEYDNFYSNDTIESSATLFRQSVNIKKPAQKEYAVLCRGKWMQNGINILENVIIEVHTQGTSTLVYSVPNFKFTFWELYDEGGQNYVRHYSPQFIQKPNSDEYYNEYVYTAKCDYMDSSHLNNTPTCMFYNKIIQDLISKEIITGSPSARNGGLDAISGFPIIMEISDQASDFDDYFNNIGSFMLNLDKTGDSLGFNVVEDGQILTCLSLEGTSNDNETGAAGRFIMPDIIPLKYNDGSSTLNIQLLKNYTSNGVIDELEIESDYNNASTAIKNLTIQESLTTLPYVQWCNFLSQGLEYRYPDSDFYKEKNGKVSKILKLDHFKKIYRMWSWVNTSDTLDQTTYRSQFENHFDLYYCILYFIQLMIFGQTDNLGKNAMFDTWGNTNIWYPRPYDLDSEAGLDNNGNDNVATFIEIMPEFSLDYSPLFTQEELVEKKLTQDSLIEYNGVEYKRYHYSSNTSKLWINFYKNYKDSINSFYRTLKDQVNYNADTIINLCKTNVIDKLGTIQYNYDFNNKYLANSDQYLSYGNRWIKFKKWMNKRFAFCDSYFDALDSATYDTNQAFSYTVQIDSPQYVIHQYQANIDSRFVLDSVTFSTGSGGATKLTLKANQSSVLFTNLFKYVKWTGGQNAYKNLLSLDVTGNTTISNITSLVGLELPNLKTLTINNSGVRQITVPSQVKTFNSTGVTLDTLIFEENCVVETIDLSGTASNPTTINGEVNFTNLIKLSTLNINGCTFKSKVTFTNLNNLTNISLAGAKFEGGIEFQGGLYFTELDFSNVIIKNITFNGNNLNFKVIKFRSTTFTDTSSIPTLNINEISKNIEILDFYKCQGIQYLELEANRQFEHLKVLNIQESSIKALGVNNDEFNASSLIFPNKISSLFKSYTSSTNNGVTTYTYNTPFTFRDTDLEKITNIDWSGSGSYLFYNCKYLQSITGTLNLISSINYMFMGCTLLNTIPTININTTTDQNNQLTDETVTTATFTFAGANSLGFNNIKSIIKKCIKVSDFSNICRCTKFFDPNDSNNTNYKQTIDLTELLGNNTAENVNLTYMFLVTRYSDITLPQVVSVSNSLIINGQIPNNVINTDAMFWNISNITVPYNILQNATSLQKSSRMFAGCSNLQFTGTLPTYFPITEGYNNAISLNNTIKKDFLPTSLKNMMGMFYGSNVQIVDTQVFEDLTLLEDCQSCFGGTNRKFTVKISSSPDVYEDVDLNISNMWINNSHLTTVAGCFSGIYNVFCTALEFHQNVTSINISGLFGLSGSTNRADSKVITINIDNIIPTIITSSYYSVPGNSTYYYGTFAYRRVIITGSSSSILSKLSSECRGLFKGAYIYVDDSIITFNLSNVKTTCQEMFNECILYKYNSDSNHQYDDTDRKFVQVLLPTSCPTYYAMFSNSSMLSDIPEVRATNASDFRYMYSSCVINNSDITLPYNYFSICKNNVTKTSYMFYNNRYLTQLQYGQTGLFEECINLNEVEYMFYQAYNLHKGIPINIFGRSDENMISLTKLSSLKGMFRRTSILFDIVDNDINKCINSDTLKPLINLTSVEAMFREVKVDGNVNVSGYSGTLRNQIPNPNSGTTYIIDPGTFAENSIQNINELFMNSEINIPFRFKGFTYGKDVFFDAPITEIDNPFITEARNISTISTVTRMFYDIISGQPSRTVTGLSDFINNISSYTHINKDNIAGNLLDSNIDNIYKANSSEANTLGYLNSHSIIAPTIYN